MADKDCNVPYPETLKDILDFYAVIGSSEHKSKVLEGVKNKVKENLSASGGFEGTVKYIERVLENITKLRTALLKERGNYGKYSSYASFSSDCISSCVENLIRSLSILHSELWYLYFHTAPESSLFGGFSWVRGKFGKAVSKSHLQSWLISKEAIPSIPKAFIASDLVELGLNVRLAFHTGINFYGGGPLNRAQLGLFLLSEGTFHHSNLASAVLFLEEFCREVSKGDSSIFSSEIKKHVIGGKDVRAVCALLSTNLKPLTGGVINALYDYRTVGEFDNDDDEDEVEDTRNSKSTKAKPATGYFTRNMYKGKLKADAFEKYKKWMENNLESVIGSLVSMKNESNGWNIEDLSNSISPGPFKYGFVFRDNKWDSEISYKLKGTLDNLTEGSKAGSLMDLLNCFKANVVLPPAPREGGEKLRGHGRIRTPVSTRDTALEKEKEPELTAEGPAEGPAVSHSKEPVSLPEDNELPPVRPLDSPHPPSPVTSHGDGIVSDGIMNESHGHQYHMLHGHNAPNKPSLAADMPIMPFMFMILFLISKIF